LFCLAYLRINITILPILYVYMAWLLKYNLALNNGVNVFHGIRINLGRKLKEENITPWIMIRVHCMNHHTNLKVLNVFKMFAWILSMYYNVCIHITTITLDPMSRVSSCLYNLILETFWKVQNWQLLIIWKLANLRKH
jgi:hypothetical protein